MESTPPRSCPLCGTPLCGRPAECPGCLESLVTYWPKVPRRPVPWRYDLRSIMVFILALAVGLGLSLRASTAGIGVPFLLLGPATVLRTSPILAKRREEGCRTGFEAAVNLYFESCLVVGVLVAAGSVAFVAVCFPVGMVTFDLDGKDPYFWMAWAGGALAALAALVLIGRRTFPPKD